MTLEDEHLSVLAELLLFGWPSKKTEDKRNCNPYWSFRGKITIIDGIALKGRRIIIPTYTHVALLQIRLTPIIMRIPSPDTLLFNRPERSPLPRCSRPLKMCDNDESNHVVSETGSPNERKKELLTQISLFYFTESIVAVQCKGEEPWMHGTVTGHASEGHSRRCY